MYYSAASTAPCVACFEESAILSTSFLLYQVFFYILILGSRSIPSKCEIFSFLSPSYPFFNYVFLLFCALLPNQFQLCLSCLVNTFPLFYTMIDFYCEFKIAYHYAVVFFCCFVGFFSQLWFINKLLFLLFFFSHFFDALVL